MGRFNRFIVEYVGNLSFFHRANPRLRPAPVDRRTNWHARELVDWVKAQLEARGYPAAKKDELLHDLRRALNQGGPAPASVTADEATGDGAPGWVADAKGVSRDAPS